MSYRNPTPTVDAILFNKKSGEILLIQRKNPPFEGWYALPGGFVDYGETVEDACKSEVLEETSLRVKSLYLFGVYSDPERDPRGHTISVAFFAPMDDFSDARAGDDAQNIKIFNIRDIKKLDMAFDHGKILDDFLKYIESPASYIQKRIP